MIRRKLVAVEDFGPGVAVTSHDGCTASLDGFAQAAAGVDEPGEGMGIAAPLGSWQRAEDRAQGCAGRCLPFRASRAILRFFMCFEHSCPGSKQLIFEARRYENTGCC